MRSLLLFFLALFPALLHAQNTPEPYAKDWRRADSLLGTDLPQSARPVVDAVYARAQRENQPVQALKAQLYLMRIGMAAAEAPDSTAIAQAESWARRSAFPYDAVWKSIAAQLYWDYYQNHRWQLYGRTRVAGAAGTDFEQWDATRFLERISTLFRESIARTDALKAVGIDTFDPILQKGVNTRSLRPTLYDLLAFRALAFFEWDEKDLPRPAFAFTMDDPAAFAPAGEFIRHRFETRDTASLQHRALELYQELLRLHQNDAQPDAFLDADLHRLEFADRTSVLPDKKERYEAALAQFAEAHRSHPLAASAQYQLAVSKWDAPGDAPAQPRDGRDSGGAPDTAGAQRYVSLKAALDRIVATYPGSEGSARAAQRLASLLQPTLDVQAEEAVLPGTPSKVLVTYRNTPQVFFRVVPIAPERWRNLDRNAITASWLAAQQPLQAFSTPLPGTGDYREHRTEVKLDALPTGLYAVAYSTTGAFDTTQLLGYTLFNVTNLAVILPAPGASAAGYVLHRKTGEPLAGAAITLYHRVWNAGKSTTQQTGTLTTGRDGAFRALQRNGSDGFLVRLGTDQFLSRGYLGFYNSQPDTGQPQTRSVFFTDRAIYRPGQTVFFKGILLRQTDRLRKAAVVSGHAVDVTFFDANGQKVATQKHTTNDFGSFTGSFTAPASGLTGSMRLEATVAGTSTGGTTFSVEEYKRPKFRVLPDTPASSYALNRPVTVRMRAESYAGAALDGATVQYRVVREARYPLWWYGWRGGPASPQAELARGTAVAAADGSFSVSFTTTPDRSIPESAQPVFTYTVTADVTDINGETHTGTQQLQAGYLSLQLNADLPEKALAADLDTIRIRTENLSGRFVPATVRLRVERLQAPAQVYRKRLWATPDQYVLDEATFRRLFPLDEYRQESDYHTWKPAATAYETSLTTTSGGLATLPRSTWSRNGWYRLTLSAGDSAGRPLEAQYWVHVWAGADAGPVSEPLLVVPERQQREPGETATVRATTGFDRVSILQLGRGLTGPEPGSWTSYTGTPLVWQKKLTAADRGGLSRQYLLVRDNRVYTGTAVIDIPWTTKQLALSWETHRDKLLPGATETWTVTVRGAQQDRVAAEVAATLYDASLDAFQPHSWSLPELFPTLYTPDAWNTQLGFGLADNVQLVWQSAKTDVPEYTKQYDDLIGLARYGGRFKPVLEPAAVAFRNAAPKGALRKGDGQNLALQEATAAGDSKDGAAAPPPPPPVDVPLRKNLQETAFFFPQLRTDSTGAVRLSFTLPEALTEWKLLAFAHTQDLATGTLSGTVKTQKDLMVVPGLPRFLRQGDDLVLSAKITNLSDRNLTGTALLQLVDAQTGQPLDLPFRLQAGTKPFTAPKGGSTTATWALHVPESRYEPVLVRISANAGAFTDGEENALPVVTNRTLVTETLPVWLNGAGTRTVENKAWAEVQTSKTRAPQALTVEYTANPAWYAVQALPYLMEYPYECAEQTFNRYYATALAAHILAQAPRVNTIFRRWETTDTAALLSNLQKNEELKTALLEETPWVLDAQNEAQQRRNIARLFETAKLARDLDATARKLTDLLLPEGGFPWFKDDTRADRYITQYILTGIGRQQKLGVADKTGQLSGIVQRCLPYLDGLQEAQYQELIRSNAKLADPHSSAADVQYLYLRSTLGKDFKTPAQAYYLGQAKTYWARGNAYTKGMAALVLHRTGDAATTATILQSLRETSLQNEELGTHWLDFGRSWWWYDAPIEAQALLIECFAEAGRDTATVDAARRWLLKQKQTQSWATTRATADACYALLRTGTDWLQADPQVTIQLGDTTIHSAEIPQQAGTGYFKVRIPGSAVTPAMSRATVTVAPSGQRTAQPSWGAVYWQYFEDLDKIRAAQSPLVVRRELFIERPTDRGPELQPITESTPLRVGDKVNARIELTTDRDLEYVYLKDARASCFEPVNVLSGYRWQGGLGYYESTRDVSGNFFIASLPKGKYVFEYPMFVTQEGTFSAGLTTVQCLYAPEFAAHSAGGRVHVSR